MKLRLLTYNLAMLPSPSGKGKKTRAEAFIREVFQQAPQFDIICLQEIFDENIREYLKKNLESDYPYIIEKSSDHDVFNQDSGIFLASKLEIKRHIFCEFTAKKCLTSDAFADKGILVTCFELETDNIRRMLHVYSAHLQSTESYYQTRAKQLSQLRDVIEKALEAEIKRTPANHLYAVLVGDFNVIGESQEYLKMISRLGHPKDLFRIKNPTNKGYTWNSQENRFIHLNDKKDHDLQRLDYAMVYDHIPYSEDSHDIIEIGKIGCDSCNLFSPRLTIQDEVLPSGCDISDHYGLDTVIDIQ